MTSQRKTADSSNDRWSFYKDETDTWRWKYIMQGRTVAQAYESFEYYAACIADARSHGYRKEAGSLQLQAVKTVTPKPPAAKTIGPKPQAAKTVGSKPPAAKAVSRERAVASRKPVSRKR